MLLLCLIAVKRLFFQYKVRMFAAILNVCSGVELCKNARRNTFPADFLSKQTLHHRLCLLQASEARRMYGKVFPYIGRIVLITTKETADRRRG